MAGRAARPVAPVSGRDPPHALHPVEIRIERGDGGGPHLERHSVLAIEVGSGPEKSDLRDLAAFAKTFPAARPLLIGAQGLPLKTALSTTADELLG